MAATPCTPAPIETTLPGTRASAITGSRVRVPNGVIVPRSKPVTARASSASGIDSLLTPSTARSFGHEIVASPVHVGSGKVRCAHGILPVPAPATAHILTGVPVYGGEIQGELCTPTGAALLKHFVNRFEAMPKMTIEKTGYGMGKKEFRGVANCLRVLCGEAYEAGDFVIELVTNADDMTPEETGFAMEMLFEAGALEVYTQSVYMKKNRPGLLINVMCREADKERVLRALFKHTTTIGVREYVSRRHVLERKTETIETENGPVRKKTSAGYGAVHAKYEYDDLAKIAREKDLSLREARGIAEAAEKQV